MTNYTNEDRSVMKKLIVPALVLLLCAVSLTGAAYAYNSSVQVDDTVDSAYFELELKDDATSSALGIFDADDKLTFDVTKTQASAGVTESVAYTLSTADGENTFVFKVLIKSDDTRNTTGFTLSKTMISISCIDGNGKANITVAQDDITVSGSGAEYSVTFKAKTTASFTDKPSDSYKFQVKITETTNA